MAAPTLRIARPVTDLGRATRMYRDGLGLEVIGAFVDHQGFDGVMLGRRDAGYHFEFTYRRTHPVAPSPTPEDLVVLYLPVKSEWESACASMERAGFARVPSLNPYWDVDGRTFEDGDGYRVVLRRGEWKPARSP